MAKARGATDGATDGAGGKEPSWLTMAKDNLHAKRPAKKGVYLSEEAAHKLETAALVEKKNVRGIDQSLIVEGLIRANLSSYKAYVPGRKGAGDDEAPPDEGE